MKKAIIFDLYDTLVQIDKKSKPYLYLLNHLTDSELTPKEVINYIMTHDMAAIKVVSAFQDVGMLDEKFDTTLFLRYLDDEVESTSPILGTYYSLNQLKDKYRLFVLSNLATPYKYPYYKYHFENWIEKAFFSCECSDKKPNASFFQKVIDYSGLSRDEIIMVGDNPISDIKAANDVGIDAILRIKDKPLIEIVKNIL